MDPARDLAVAVEAAVDAALLESPSGFDDAVAELIHVYRDVIKVVLGEVTRDLLERAFPDGLDSDDAEQVLTRTSQWARRWCRDVDDDALVVALTGSLGVSSDEPAPFTEPVVQRHGVLLVAQLLTGAGEPLSVVLGRALGELRRAQTMELP